MTNFTLQTYFVDLFIHAEDMAEIVLLDDNAGGGYQRQSPGSALQEPKPCRWESSPIATRRNRDMRRDVSPVLSPPRMPTRRTSTASTTPPRIPTRRESLKSFTNNKDPLLDEGRASPHSVCDSFVFTGAKFMPTLSTDLDDE